MMPTVVPRLRHAPPRQRGASLIVVMLILVVVSALGIGAAQVSLMSERSARNDRDMQVAWQAAEAALVDAETDIRGGTSTRPVFSSQGATPDLSLFDVAGCGTADGGRGLCALVDDARAAAGEQQKWLTVDFTVSGDAAPSTAFGTFTNRQYPFGTGVRPARVPRYVIEPIRDFWAMRDKSAQTNATYMYRATAMGFGPREDIQAVGQAIVRP